MRHCMYVNKRPVCHLYGDSVLVMEEYNIRRHYEMLLKRKDKEKFKNMDMDKSYRR